MKFRLFAALLAMPVLLALNAVALAQATGAAPKTIEVTGHGDSSAKPDLMTLSFAVTSHSDSADECTRNEAEISRRVVDALQAKLGDSAKVTTSDFSFNPSVEYGGGMATPTPTVWHAEEPPATWEFKANVSVFADSLEPLGDLIEAGLAAGATSVSDSGVGEMPDEPDENPPEVTGAKVGTATGTLYGGNEYRRRRQRAYYVGLSVESQGASPADCVRKGNALVNQVEAALKKQMGGRGKVIVSNFDVDEINPEQRAGIPRYQYQPPPQQPQRKVYDARVTVSAETTKLELLGPVVEDAMKAGAAQLNQVSFTLKDDSAARKEAIEKASADAKSKAETLASSMGVKLKGILRISTNAQTRPYIVYGSQYAEAASMAMHHLEVTSPESAQMPVTPRDVSFSADVNVTYQIE
jgi:uncharacterized protein YggE